MRGHLLRVLQFGFGVFEVGRDAGATEGVIADAGRLDHGLFRAAFDHRPGPLPVQSALAQLLGLSIDGSEEGRVLVFADPGGLDVLLKPVLQVVLAGHLMVLAAFLVQPDP